MTNTNQNDHPRRGLKMGERLLSQGVMTREQVDQVLSVQRESTRPFGDIAERMYGIEPDLIEAVWMDQYREQASELDSAPPEPNPRALASVTARQAWQFRILPLSIENGTLIAATTARHLAQASRFATAVLGRPVMLRVADSEVLANLLTRFYPLAGLDVRHLRCGVRLPVDEQENEETPESGMATRGLEPRTRAFSMRCSTN